MKKNVSSLLSPSPPGVVLRPEVVSHPDSAGLKARLCPQSARPALLRLALSDAEEKDSPFYGRFNVDCMEAAAKAAGTRD